MTLLNRLPGYLILCVAIICFGITTTPLAQSSSKEGELSSSTVQDDMQLLQALLDEVHKLRLAVQQSNINSHRTQIMIERIRIQQERVNSLSRELSDIRISLDDAKLNRPRMAERLKDMEARLNQEADQGFRAALESEYKEFKQTVEQQAIMEQQQHDREIQLTQALQVEQNKLEEFNSQLEELAVNEKSNL